METAHRFAEGDGLFLYTKTEKHERFSLRKKTGGADQK